MTDDQFSNPPTSRRSGRKGRRGMGAAAKMGLLLFAAFALLGATGAVVAVNAFATLRGGLPDPTGLEKIELPEQSVVYDRTGTVELARFGEFNREVVTFDQLPAVLVDATTAVEDGSFWDNAGFDPIGILASGVDAIRGRARGGSTITQQLVRQRLLTETGAARTELSAERKLKEIIQSIRVTQAFPGAPGKQRIMAAYLNQNFYGNESYGVAAAAKSYFGVGLDELTLAQAAILAALPKAPGSYDLVRNAVVECLDLTQDSEACTETQLVVPDDSTIVQRRNQVLRLMADDRTPLTGDRYTQADFDAAMREKVILAPQRSSPWKLPQFVWQVRRELATRLCGEDIETCPKLERGGLTIISTIDMRLQDIAERWVKAATIVPHAKSPKAAAKALGLPYEPWMANLRNKSLRNGALIAMDYVTGQIVAYQGSADPTATKATKRFQPAYDVLADGWRQPGSAFKPIVYATGIDEKKITAASMFMDVVTNFGGGYTPTDADNLERGPVRASDALQFSLNIPAVKAVQVIGNDSVQATAEEMGIVFRGDKVDAGSTFALGVEEVHPKDLVRAYGVLANKGVLVDQTTIISVTDSNGEAVLGEDMLADPAQAIDPGTAAIVTDILADNTDPKQNPFWGKFKITEGSRRRPATLKTGTNNDALDLSAYGYIAAPGAGERAAGEYALVVGTWNGNSDNTRVSKPSDPLFSINVTTYVWQGFLQEATSGWSINRFTRPPDLIEAAVDPWTGLASEGGVSVAELFLPGTAPETGIPADQRCGEAVLTTAGFEDEHPSWMRANQGWMQRAEKGPGVRGGPENTKTAYFYNGAFMPYGQSWGPLMGTGNGCAAPSPSPSIDPCASPDPSASATPVAPVDPSASPVVCPSPSDLPSASPSESPSASPSDEPTAPPTPTPTPTEPPTTPPTAPPTPTPTDAPVPTAEPPSPAA